MRIVVLAGGLSPERDVSLSSGSLIANALIENGHDVLLVDLYIGIQSENNELPFLNKNSSERYHFQIPASEPDLKKLKNESENGENLIGKNVLDICRSVDIVFIALHGSIGENGQLQAVFDAYGICYTGSGYIGSLLAMDKDISKKLMVINDIKTACWNLYNIQEADIFDFKNVLYPCVVKPCSCGSSVGISIVENQDELNQAISYAKIHENLILIEDKITGREFSVGILNDIALPVIEIIPKMGFYDYKNKYQSGMSDEVCPANINDNITRKIQSVALSVHKILRLGFYSRIDFILDDKNDIYCLEANTLPGMTPTSLLPQEAKAAGISYNELCERIAMSVKQ
ncbi:MAG: D-alanine--D-alanine ligase family protein [Saccharofermentanales bacterium]